MLNQIINATSSDLISEIALKCGDIYFQDFPKNVYVQSLYRAQRAIAKEFKILDRIWTYTNTAGISPIQVVPTNFNGAWRVTITPASGSETEYQHKQVDEVLDPDNLLETYYALLYNTNIWNLYYVGATADDVITIYYTASIDGSIDYESTDAEGNDQGLPALPDKYDDETIRRAVRYMAQLGIANFAADKREKYEKIFSVYTRRDDENRELHLDRDRPFIKIKPFQYP